MKRYLVRRGGKVFVNITSQCGTLYTAQTSLDEAGPLLPLKDFLIHARVEWGGAWPISRVDAVRELRISSTRLNQLVQCGSLSLFKDGPALIPWAADYGVSQMKAEYNSAVGAANAAKARAGAAARWDITSGTSRQ